MGKDPSSSDDRSHKTDASRPTTQYVPDQRSSQTDDSFAVDPTPRVGIGRYQIISELGKGGFGHVYRAFDPELNCEVAIKIPRSDRILRAGEVERFRNEARTLARIRNHPSIVTVYDVGQTDDGIVYAVMEFVEGETLSNHIANRQLTIDESLQIFLKIGQGLKAAHQAAIIHRDLKPSNVILDNNQNIILVDFGLALHDDLSLADLTSTVEGTPSYMAPEQIRGENHRIDGQTDIWALGVIMYRMLTGKHPFRGKDTNELARTIRYKDAKPLRQLMPEIPKEIERICLKCLSKNMSDRYLSVTDLIDELSSAVVDLQATSDPDNVSATRSLQNIYQEPEIAAGRVDSDRTGPSGRSEPSGSGDPSRIQHLQITYKGLRPFDSNDSDFFLQLLPGPRTRDDIPESIQFWRSRILGDELEPLDVGLIYGPSGCGKSSFVRAGLLPVLPPQINPVYLECTSENSERRLAQQIAHRIDSVDGEDTLSDILRQIRRGMHLDQHDKLLIVLDQFEQWLHGNSNFNGHELTDALRQCDGEKVSCILLIRDDFWMSISEFMKTLDIPIREGNNALALPLFDERHARKVLLAYGCSFDRLPHSTNEQGTSLNVQQNRFIRDAVTSLSQNGKVICVHLTVFAQIAKDREWTADELNRLGGLKGVGVRFLDDVFASQSSSKYRNDQDEIVKSIFRDLLPGKTTVIKGTSKTREELWNGLNGIYSRQKFDQVLNRLESELRLVSLVDLDEWDAPTHEMEKVTTDSFRLTHDFLVAPIVDWLDRRQKETWRGRAEIRLKELGERWSETHSNRFLPTPLEYSQFVWGIDKNNLSFHAKQVLRSAHKHYAVWGAIVTFVLVSTIGMFIWTLDKSADNTARTVYETLQEARPAAVIPYIDRVSQYRKKIAKLIEKHDVVHASPLRRAMAAVVCDMNSAEYIDAIVSQLDSMTDDDVFNVQYIFLSSPMRSKFVDTCTQKFFESPSNLERARIASVLASFGELRCLNEAARVDQDQTDRTLLICNFEKHVSDKTLPFAILQTADNPEVQSAMLAVIALQNPEVYASQVDVVRNVVQELYNTSPGSAVHGFAEALATKNNWKLKENASEAENSRWKIVPEFDFTLVQIPAGELVIEKTAGQGGNERQQIDSFWISDREVTNRVFFDFLHDENYQDEKPDLNLYNHIQPDDKPVRGVTLNDAKMLCNWLSWKTKRTSVYVLADGNSSTNAQANGFRLPDNFELEYACRCSGATALHIGDLSVNKFIHFFENKAVNRLDAPEFEYDDTAQKLPNPWGLFDTLGNAAELCVDPENDDRTYCRGFFYDCFAADKDNLSRESRRPDVGVRLAVDQVVVDADSH